MKRCSSCNRTYTDPNLSFCIDDGTPLTNVAPADETTVVSPRAAETSSGSELNPAPYQPPGAYVPPGTPPKRRRVWPWVLGIGGAFLLGIVVVGIAAVVWVPSVLRRANERTRVNIETRNDNQSENANANESADNNANVDVNAPAPTDRDQVLAQLTELENEWTVANFNADKRKLSRILADDYVGPDPDGKPQGKADYIRTIQRNTDIDKWEFSDLTVLLLGDRATLVGKIKLFSRGREAQFVFKDKFVWRDGRWQATGSEVTPIEQDQDNVNNH